MNLRELNLKQTKEDLINQFDRDNLIIQTIHSIELIESSTTKLIANLASGRQ